MNDVHIMYLDTADVVCGINLSMIFQKELRTRL